MTSQQLLPNIILTMCDDLGYGDTGFNGNAVLRTPHLDAMARHGARFTRFYAGGPVCSPTRGTCLTGRHYFRYGITHANRGILRHEERSLAKLLKERGYVTGHFGKWHLGTLTRDERDSNRGGVEGDTYFSPPWEHGFDDCFSTEAKVPTWDPMVAPAEAGANWGVPGAPFGTSYWDETGRRVTDNLAGDDSRAIMDRAIPFIRDAARRGVPFLAVIWFHAPHSPVVAGPDYRAMYADYSEGEQHYYGCVTAMDEQIGRLTAELDALGVRGNTMHWFCSDNGPEGPDGQMRRNRGSTGGLRGRKRSLYNGGVGVPALLDWPGLADPGRVIASPCSTLDYLPTIAGALGLDLPAGWPLDGIDLLPMLRGEAEARGRPIPYRFVERRQAMFGSPTLAMIDDRYKLLTHLVGEATEDAVYDLIADPFETTNLIGEQAGFAAAMRGRLREFLASCRESHHGGDYGAPFEPLDPYEEVTGTWAPARGAEIASGE